MSSGSPTKLLTLEDSMAFVRAFPGKIPDSVRTGMCKIIECHMVSVQPCNSQIMVSPIAVNHSIQTGHKRRRAELEMLKLEQEVKTSEQTRIISLIGEYKEICKDVSMDEDTRATCKDMLQMLLKKARDSTCQVQTVLQQTEIPPVKMENKADTKHFFAGLAKEDPSVIIQKYGARELYTKYTDFHALAVQPKYSTPMTETAFGREIKNISGVYKKRTNASAMYTLNYEMIRQALASS